MEEPWKKYQPAADQSEEGPWTRYQSTEIAPPAPPAAPAAKPSGIIRRTLGDAAVKAGQGVIGLGETAVGLADIPSMGYAGRGLEAIGWRPRETKEIIGSALSPEARQAEENLRNAKGFVPTIVAGFENPSAVAGAVAESVPSLLAGGAIGRGIGLIPKAGRLISPLARGAIGEGAVGAGQAAEGFRQGNDDGLLTARQAASSVGSGVGTGLLTAAGGRIARQLGIEDIDTALAGGGTAAPRAAASSGARGALRRFGQGVVSEGVLEEMPQSMQEQAWQNFGTDRPLGEGVAEQGAIGLLAGGAIGGPLAAIRRSTAIETQPIPGQPEDTTNPSVPALPPPGPITVDTGGNATTPEQDYQRQQGQFRRGYNGSRPIIDTEFTDVTPPTPADLPALPPPGGLDRTIDIAPDGTAFAPGQMADQQQADADLAQSRANVGLTPDVNRARARNPAAAPNTLPDGAPLPDPGNGSISRAVNIAAETGALQQAADQRAMAQATQRDASRSQPTQAARANGMDPAYRDQLKSLIHDAAELNGNVPDLQTLRSTYDLDQRDAAELRREVVIERRTVAPPASITPSAEASPTWTRQQMSAYLVQQATRGPLPDTRTIADTFGLKPREAGALRREAIIQSRAAPATAVQPDPAQSPSIQPTQVQPESIQPTTIQGPTNVPVTEGPITQGPIASGAVDNGGDAGAPGVVAGDPAGQEAGILTPPAPAADAQVQPVAPPSEQADQQPTTPPQGGVAASGPVAQAPARPRRQAAKADRSGKPMDLLRVIAANGGLDREDFRRNGVDPAELGRRAGFHYVFRKRGKDGAARGMTLSDLREFMQQEGYLPADSPDRPAEVDDNDALDVFDRAFRGGEEVYAPDQMDAVAAYRERQEAENDAFREEEARAAVQSGSDAEFDAFLNGETQDLAGAPQDGFEWGFDVLLQQAMDLGATDAQIMDAFNGDVNEGLQSLINRLETETDGREQDFAGEEAGASEVSARAAQRAGTGPGELPPEPGRAPGGIPSEAGEEVADSSPAPGGLFAAPTAREQVDAARRDRDAARDGRTGSGRTDIQAGEGELFAGPRPEQTEVEAAAAAAATSPGNDRPEPTDAQKEAGNYAKGHLRIDGLDISIENPAGTRRRPEWPPIQHAYGYIKGTIGKDKDHVDVFLSDRATDTSLPVFVVDQNHANGRFDEHKVMLGFEDEASARAGYLANYSKGWNGLADITQMTHAEFKDWVRNQDQTSRRAADLRPAAGDNTVELREDGARYERTNGPVSTVGEGGGDADANAGARRGSGRADAIRGQLDLFVHTPRQARAVSAEARQRYATEVKSVTTGVFRSGISQVNTWQDAAHIIAPLRKSPQEQVLALVVDGQGKPLRVIRHTIGGVSSAQVYTVPLLGAVSGTPGARAVYFAHNHPSGSIGQSSADRSLTSRLHGLLEGSGIEARGMIVVAPQSRQASYYLPSSDENRDRLTVANRTGAGSTLVPQVERKIRRSVAATDAAADPNAAAGLVKSAVDSGVQSGLLLLNTRNQMVGTLPISPAEMRLLRTGDPSRGTARVLSEIERANASAAIIFGGDTAAQDNVAGLLRQVEMRVLDAFGVENGTVGESRAATGRTIGTSNFFSRPDRSLFNVVNQLKEGSRTPPQTRAQVTAAITGITSKWKGDRPRVVVLESAEGLPEHVKSDPAYRTAEGFYDQATRTAYLVAPNIRGGYDMALKRQVTPRERAQMVLAHEVIGHYAIEDITGPELWRQIGDAVQRMREGGEQADLFAEIGRRNPGASQEVLLKETLAVMAEKGVRNSIMDRIAAAVRRFLRAMGFDLRVSDAELRQHIARAARHVEVAADANAPAGAQAGETFPSRPDLDLRKQVPVVNMAGGVFGDPARELKAVRVRAQDYLRKIRDAGRLMTNEDTGWKIGLSGAGIRELTHFDPAKLNMLLALPRITRVAVLANTRRAEKGSLAKAFHTLYAPVRVNQDLRIARLVVREDVNGNFAYDFQQSDVLEKMNPVPAGIPAIEPGARQDTGSGGTNRTALDPLVEGGATRQAGAFMTLAQLRDAVNAIDRPGWQWSQSGDQFRTDARGNPFVQRGNDRFVQRGDQWYLADAAGRPTDFLTLGRARTEAERTGGQVSADPNEGARRTWSVVLPDGAGVSRAASENLFSQPDTEREGQGLRDRMNDQARRIFDGVDKVMPGRREFPERMDEQQRAAAKKFATFAPKEKLADRYDRIKAKAADKLVQRVFDQFRPLRGLSPTAFMQAHLSKGTDGALEAAFKYGAPVLRDGAYAVDTRDGGVQAVLSKLQGEHETMLMWMVGNRAERLLSEGRENLFNKDDIAALKRLADGKMPGGTDRATAYRAAMKEINRYNRAFLDIAEKAGVVNAESRKVWEDEFYIPFYREMEQGSNAGPGQVGLLRQRVIERLAGGSDILGDPLENMLANWSHMLTASMRNMAANNALDQGVLAGVATSLEKPEKDSVWTMRDGKEAYWHVNDPMVLEALESLNFNGYDNPLMRQAGKFKRALTIGVTASPSFRVRNMLRDSLSALGTAEVGYNPLRNMVDGWKATNRDTDTQLNLIAGGGTIRFGSFNDGDQAANAKRLISMGVGENQILDTKDKVRNAFRRLVDQWQEIGDRAETINRAVIYQRAIDAGKSHLEASFEARDLMNFTSMGSSSAIRALTQVLPFFNARLQGTDRLIRGAKANPRRFAAVAGTVAMASALLYLLNADDDDYKALPDYVRDTYWPIKLGGKWLYLPKPFEIGAMGTVVERMTELAVAGDDYQAKDFRNTLVSVLSSQLAMNPIPQIVRPVTEAAFNYDMFRRAPIDALGQQNLLPQDRYTARTAAPAVAAGKLTGISPQRLEHMVEGYFGWLGIQALNAGDWAMRGAMGLPSNPNRDLTKTNNLFVIGDFVKEKGTTSNKYLTRFYDVQGEIDQIYASASLARKAGDIERVQQLLQDPKMRLRPAFQAVDKQITRINQQIKQVNNSRELSAREKNDRLLRLNALRAEAAQRADRIARQQP